MICPETQSEQSRTQFFIEMMKDLDESIEEQVQCIIDEIEKAYEG